MALGVGVSVSSGYSSANSTTTGSVTTQATGSILIIAVVWEPNSTPPTISDSKGNSYSLIGSVRQASAYPSYIGFWRCENATGGASHTFTGAKSNGYCSIFAMEITGGATSSALDQNTGAASDTATPVTSGSITTTTADQILIGFVGGLCSANTAYTANNSFTKIQELTSVAEWQGCLSYRIVTGTGTYETSTAVTNLTSFGGLIASFKALAAAGGNRRRRVLLTRAA